MTEENKHIDQVFRDKLANFEETPPAIVWENIQANLAGQKRKKLMLYWRVAGAAAVLLLAFVAGWQFSRNNVLRTEVVVENNASVNIPEPTNSKAIKPQSDNTPAQNDVFAENSNSSLLMKPVSTNQKLESKQLSTQQETEGPTTIQLLQAIIQSPKPDVQNLAKNNPLMGKVLFTPEELRIIEQNKSMLATNSNNKEQRKWMVGAAVSPVYSIMQSDQTAEYSRNMANPESNDKLNLGGGLSFEYKTNKKWSFQSGVYYNKLEQSSSNSSSNKYSAQSLVSGLDNYFSTPVNEHNGTLEMNTVAGVIRINNLPSSVQLEGSLDREMLSSTALVSNANFDQNFEYLEIPLFVKYQVLDAKVGVNLLSGLSTSILVGNNVYLQNNLGREKVGTTNGMVDMNYSGILGLELSYALTSNLYLNIEPRFKYFFNSLNDDSSLSYKPYTLGVYTGISYSF